MSQRGRTSTQAQRKASAQRRTRDEFDQVLLAEHDQALLDRVNDLVSKAEGLVGTWPVRFDAVRRL